MMNDLEYAISQYLDGTLPPLEREALERRLAEDPQARRLLEEHRALDELLKRSQPLPELQWDRLAEHLSAAVATQEAPVRTYRIGITRYTRRIAVAAAVLLAAAAGIAVYLAEAPLALRGTEMAEVRGPQAESSPGPVVEMVSIGPSPGIGQDEVSRRYAESVVSRPSRVIIASGYDSAQDRDRWPY